MTPEKALYIADYCLDNTQVREALKDMARQVETAYKSGRESMRDEAANYAEGEFDFCGDELLVADGIRKIEP